MFHKIKPTFIIAFTMVFFVMVLTSCKESDSSLEKRKANLEKRAEEVQEILNSRYAEEYDQALKECKELVKDKNADPNKVAEVEKKLAEISSKMGIFHFAAIECKHGSIFAPQ